MALLRNISKVSPPRICRLSVLSGRNFFSRNRWEEVAAIKDIGNYFDRAEYIKWKILPRHRRCPLYRPGMPRVLGRLPYGPDTVPVRSFSTTLSR
ncbi:type VI secretion system contractile sheath large subunit [Enterobacter cloacae subsp. cloacae]|nr:type VI secretion system contractile sheath large subunit [Enterobacter cloacae subsp. cloacae]